MSEKLSLILLFLNIYNNAKIVKLYIEQEHCPFNIIHEDASTAGGDPTFLCEGTLYTGYLAIPGFNTFPRPILGTMVHIRMSLKVLKKNWSWPIVIVLFLPSGIRSV